MGIRKHKGELSQWEHMRQKTTTQDRNTSLTLTPLKAPQGPSEGPSGQVYKGTAGLQSGTHSKRPWQSRELGRVSLGSLSGQDKT